MSPRFSTAPEACWLYGAHFNLDLARTQPEVNANWSLPDESTHKLHALSAAAQRQAPPQDSCRIPVKGARLRLLWRTR